MSGIGLSVPPTFSGAADRIGALATSDRRSALYARRALLSLAFVFGVDRVFGLTPFLFVNGLALGALYGIVGVALVLTYRTSRIINFAAAAVGAVPAITAVLLSTADHVNYLVTLPLALIGGVLSGVLTEVLVLRRFKSAS